MFTRMLASALHTILWPRTSRLQQPRPVLYTPQPSPLPTHRVPTSEDYSSPPVWTAIVCPNGPVSCPANAERVMLNCCVCNRGWETVFVDEFRQVLKWVHHRRLGGSVIKLATKWRRQKTACYRLSSYRRYPLHAHIIFIITSSSSSITAPCLQFPHFGHSEMT